MTDKIPDDLREKAEEAFLHASIMSIRDQQIDIIAQALAAERERCAIICDKESDAMQRVADFHRPPRVDYDPSASELHDQGAAVASRLAAAIRSPS